MIDVQINRRDEYKAKTRAALLEAAIEVFAAKGYAKGSTTAVAKSARVTRGAFYHHFPNKMVLFEAVVIALSTDAAREIQASALLHKTLWKQLRVGIETYLDICTRIEFGRIVVRDAPSVLGEVRFREIDNQNAGALLLVNLKALQADGDISCKNTVLLAQLLDAMICRIATLLQDCDDATRVKAEGLETIMAALEGFKVK